MTEYAQILRDGEIYNISQDKDPVLFNGLYFINQKTGKRYPANVKASQERKLENIINNLDDVIPFVCRIRKISKKEIIGHSRKIECVIARHFVVYLATERLKSGRSELGRLLGNRNHATIINMLKNKERKPWIYEMYQKAIEKFI